MKTFLSVLVVSSFIAGVASAQSGGNFHIVASIVDGGAGMVSGAGYSINGTVGQFDSGSSSGGNFAVRGGFWPDFSQSLPLLRIERAGVLVLIAWPASFAGFQLEQSAALGPGASWGHVPQSVRVVNGENQVTLTIDPGARFFRLHKP